MTIEMRSKAGVGSACGSGSASAVREEYHWNPGASRKGRLEKWKVRTQMEWSAKVALHSLQRGAEREGSRLREIERTPETREWAMRIA